MSACHILFIHRTRLRTQARRTIPPLAGDNHAVNNITCVGDALLQQQFVTGHMCDAALRLQNQMVQARDPCQWHSEQGVQPTSSQTNNHCVHEQRRCAQRIMMNCQPSHAQDFDTPILSATQTRLQTTESTTKRSCKMVVQKRTQRQKCNGTMVPNTHHGRLA